MHPAPTDHAALFIDAVARRDVRAALRIARTGAPIHELQVPTGYGYERVLHSAVRLNSVALANVLLEQGMDVDVADSRGYTPLSLAPELYSRLSVVKLLVRGEIQHRRVPKWTNTKK